MSRPKTIDSFLKKKKCVFFRNKPLAMDLNVSLTHEQPSKYPRIHYEEIDATCLERDPGLRLQIRKLPVNLQNEMRCAYLKVGPCQAILKEYPPSGLENHCRQFQASWFQTYST